MKGLLERLKKAELHLVRFWARSLASQDVSRPPFHIAHEY